MFKTISYPHRRKRLGHLTYPLLSAGLVFLVSCQNYTPQALDLTAHRERWKNQSPQSQKVSDFAKTLAKSRPSNRASYDPSDGLSLSEGELVALVYNPDLRTSRLQAGIAKAATNTAGLWDDPSFGLEVTKIAESIPDPWIIGSGLSLTIPISGRLAAEKARAEAEAEASLDRLAEKEWQVRYQLRNAWLEWSAQKITLQETEAFLANLTPIIDSTTKLQELGELPATEASLFRIEQESRTAERDRIQSQIAESEQVLRSLMGLAPSAPVSLIPSLTAGKAPSVKAPSPNSNPTLIRLRSEYAVAERTLQREVRKQYPDLTIGPQLGTDEGQSLIGFVSSIPLPVLNSNKGGIANARGQREIARASFETEYERLSGQLAILAERQDGLESQRNSLTQTLVPLVDGQATKARKLLELGEGSSLVLLESLTRAQDTKLRLVALQLKVAQNQNEIRHLIGPNN